MPVSGYISITLKYDDVVKIDKMKKGNEKRSDVIRRALAALEEMEEKR